MPRIIGKLSASRVRTAKPKAGRTALVLADGGNLYLQATLGDDGNVRRSWVFRYAIDGRRREMGLGATHTLGLAEARDKARTLRKQLLDDVDPLEAKAAAKQARLAERAKAMTFRQCAAAYISLHGDGWGREHLHQWNASLAAYVYPKIGDMPVRDVDQAAVMRIVEPLWKTKTTTAGRVRSRIEAVLDYATAHKFYEGDNPARVLAALPKKSKVAPVKHFASVPWQEIPTFMAELGGLESTAARCLEFAVLTAARSDEAIGAEWDEIKGDTWEVPASRMKGRVLHRVPLNKRALKLLASLPKDGRYIFGGGKPLQETALRRTVLAKLRPGANRLRSSVTVHGLRASFKTWASESTAFPRDLVEVALAHKRGGAVEQAYERGDLFEKRRRLMSAWADYCAEPKAATGTIVTPIRERA
jgi:integrase